MTYKDLEMIMNECVESTFKKCLTERDKLSKKKMGNVKNCFPDDGVSCLNGKQMEEEWVSQIQDNGWERLLPYG
jgi:hypothetical protein